MGFGETLVSKVQSEKEKEEEVQMVRSPTLTVESENRWEKDGNIYSKYQYETVQSQLSKDGTTVHVRPVTKNYLFKVQKDVPRVGVMIVGLGGNNGTTFTAAAIANRENIHWEDERSVHPPNFLGSITQSSTVRMGLNARKEEVHVPLKSLLPMVDPTQLVIGGWDISSMNMADAMKRAQVLPIDLQRKLRPYLESVKPLPGIYAPHFIAKNQSERADNVIATTSHSDAIKQIRSDISTFKQENDLDKVIILWSANTERFAELKQGINDTAANLMAAIEKGTEKEISPSTLYCIASLLENCPYINGSPQNTFVPGVIELAIQRNIPIGGDDFKSGQTKFKSALVEFLVSAGIKPCSIASYNHLGNNDGMNLSEPSCFRSKEISKSDVVLDMVKSNSLMYKPGEKPDHTVVIKYMPYVGDSKRAMDEYVSEILFNGKNTIVVHNTCEDSLLAAPLMFDLVVLTELFTRIGFNCGQEGQSVESVKEKCAEMKFDTFHPVMSILSYMLKAPKVPAGSTVVNALSRQRACIENVLRACTGLPPENNMWLEHMA